MLDHSKISRKKIELRTKAQVETDGRFGKRPEERTIDEHIRFGVINLNKPPNPSSHQVAAWARKILGVSHIGHGGTLEAEKVGETRWSQAYSQ